MAGYLGFVETRRAVLAMSGADARTVLQGVVTNDVDAVAPGQAVYAALLTPQGKYLFDFFLIEGGPDRLLIDVAADRAPALAQRLKMYCLRRDAAIDPVDDLGVALIWSHGSDQQPKSPGMTIVGDPRADALGWRCYGAVSGDALTAAGVEPGSPADYDVLRVDHLVPESGTELVPDQSYILEMGFERLSGVDFRKGCYVGQEVTARMKHKTELRKGLTQVKVTGNAPPGTPIVASGKPAGTLFTSVDGRALAHLRFDRAGPGMTADGATVDYASA